MELFLEAIEEQDQLEVKKMAVAFRASNMKDKDFKKFMES